MISVPECRQRLEAGEISTYSERAACFLEPRRVQLEDRQACCSCAPTIHSSASCSWLQCPAKYWSLGVLLSLVPAFTADKTIRRHSLWMEPAEQQGLVRSITEVLIETPLLNVLPPAAVKSLSATCRSLRTCFRARVRVISLSDPAGIPKLCCTTWPKLLTVVCTNFSHLRSKLSADWRYMAELQLEMSREHSSLTDQQNPDSSLGLPTSHSCDQYLKPTWRCHVRLCLQAQA